MHVALDAWDIAVRPSSLEAWRTREILEISGPAVAGWQWSPIRPVTRPADFPAGVKAVEAGAHRGEWGHLVFEQVALPRAAARLGADVILTLAGSPPLSSPTPLVTEGHHDVPAGRSVADRLRGATRAAASLGAAVFTWSDLPGRAAESGTMSRLSPWVADRFRALPEAEDASVRARHGLEDDYVLALGVGVEDAGRLLSSWSWVAPSVGHAHPLVLAGLDANGALAAAHAANRIELGDSLRFANEVHYADLPAVLRGAALLLVPGKPSDGQLLRWALACGLPVAAAATPDAESILGEAAYMTPADEARGLGAACLSLLAEKDLAHALRMTDARRSADYHSGRGVEELAGLLRRSAHPE